MTPGSLCSVRQDEFLSGMADGQILCCMALTDAGMTDCSCSVHEKVIKASEGAGSACPGSVRKVLADDEPLLMAGR